MMKSLENANTQEKIFALLLCCTEKPHPMTLTAPSTSLESIPMEPPSELWPTSASCALMTESTITNGSAAAELLSSLQHWSPEPWQCAACSHCMGKIVQTYRGWRVKEQFVFSLVIAGVCRGLGRAAPCTRGIWTRPDPWQLSFISSTHVLEFMVPFYKPEISSSTSRNRAWSNTNFNW